jgi:hypothetical protein
MAREEEFPVVYSNLAKITHVALEFLVDFKRLAPESRAVDTAPTLVRIVSSFAQRGSVRRAIW